MSMPHLKPADDGYPPIMHSSALLQQLIDTAPADTFTLGWVIDSMPSGSYGLIILVLGLLSLVPVIGVVARLLIMLMMLQIICGYRTPILPEKWLLRPLASRHLTRMPPFAIRSLQQLEKSVRPRWAPMLGTRRLSGLIVLLVTLLSLIAPLPFANVPSAAITVLMALAYMEHDGLMLVVAQLAGLAMLALTAAVLLIRV